MFILFAILAVALWFLGNHLLPQFLQESLEKDFKFQKIEMTGGFPFTWEGEITDVEIDERPLKLKTDKLHFSIRPWMLLQIELWAEGKVDIEIQDYKKRRYFDINADKLQFEANFVLPTQSFQFVARNAEVKENNKNILSAEYFDATVSIHQDKEKKTIRGVLDSKDFYISPELIEEKKARAFFKEKMQVAFDFTLREKAIQRTILNEPTFDRLIVDYFNFDNKDMAFKADTDLTLDEKHYLTGKINIDGLELDELLHKMQKNKILSSLQKNSFQVFLSSISKKKQRKKSITADLKNGHVYIGPLSIYKMKPFYE